MANGIDELFGDPALPVEALLQANVVVSVPQQFADSVGLVLEEVDAVFPP